MLVTLDQMSSVEERAHSSQRERAAPVVFGSREVDSGHRESRTARASETRIPAVQRIDGGTDPRPRTRGRTDRIPNSTADMAADTALMTRGAKGTE